MSIKSYQNMLMEIKNKILNKVQWVIQEKRRKEQSTNS
jgi:hypothetical protein